MEQLDCHKIKHIKGEFRSALPDGDNGSSVQIDDKTLYTKVYTRNDFPDKADIITLVEYIKGIYFSNAVKWICDVCGYDYYDKEITEQEQDPCVLWLNQVSPKSKRSEDERLIIYDKTVLNYCAIEPNLWFLKEGISYKTQTVFMDGFDTNSLRITIPIYDELGNLVGLKGRTIDQDYKEKGIPKYLYLLSTAKSKILYGLDKAYPYIKQKGGCFVVESEKAVQQAWTMGIRNVVACGGHSLSQTQVIKLERLRVPVVIAYDKGLPKKELEKEYDKFIMNGLYVMKDKFGLLKDKEAPTDLGKDVFVELYQKGLERIK